MSELDEIRQQFPEYANWSDQKLGRALKKKAQPDMPDEEYWSELGVDPNGLTLMGKPFPESEEELGAMEKFYRASGIHGANKGFANIFGFGEHVKNAQEAARKAAQTHPNATKAGEIAADVYSSIPFFMAGGHAAKAIPGATNFPQFAKILGAAAGGGIFNALPEPEEGDTRLGNFATGGATAGLIEAALPAIGKAFKHLAPYLSRSSRVAKSAEGLLSPSELAANLRAVEGTNTNIGSVIGSPKIAHELSNDIMPKANYSVVDNLLKDTESQVMQRADNVVNKASKGLPSTADLNTLTKNLVDASAKESKHVKTELYKPVSALAAKEGLTFELPKFKKIAEENAAAIADSPVLKNNAELKSLYNKLLSLSKTTEEIPVKNLGANALMSPPKIKTSPLVDVKHVLNELGKQGEKMQGSLSTAEQSQGDLLVKLAKAGRDDVRDVITSKGSQEIQNAYKKAESYYSSDYSRFLDRDVQKLVQEQDYDTLVNKIIKASKKNDQTSLINKVTEILPANQKHVLGAAYLKKAIDKNDILQPTELNTLINNLGNKQFKALFPDKEMRDALLDFQRLKNMNAESINRWFNPKTGNRNNTMIAKVYSALKGGGVGSTVGGIAGAALGMPTLGAGAGGLAGGVLDRMNATRLSKLYTSPEFRNAVVNKMKSHGATNSKEMPAIFTEALKAAAASQLLPKRESGE